MGRAWTPKEDARLRGLWHDHPMEVICAEIPGRTLGALRARARELKLQRDRTLPQRRRAPLTCPGDLWRHTGRKDGRLEGLYQVVQVVGARYLMQRLSDGFCIWVEREFLLIPSQVQWRRESEEEEARPNGEGGNLLPEQVVGVQDVRTAEAPDHPPGAPRPADDRDPGRAAQPCAARTG